MMFLLQKTLDYVKADWWIYTEEGSLNLHCTVTLIGHSRQGAELTLYSDADWSPDRGRNSVIGDTHVGISTVTGDVLNE